MTLTQSNQERQIKPLWFLFLWASSAIFCVGVSWSSLVAITQRWSNDFQVPQRCVVILFAGYVLWSRKSLLDSVRSTLVRYAVLLILFGAAMAKLGGDGLALITLLAMAAGLVMMSVGRGAMRWSWPGLAMLSFLLPLPMRLELAMAGGLQKLTNPSNALVLRMVGSASLSTLVDSHRLGAETVRSIESTVGLNSMLAFFAMALGVSFLVPRSWLVRWVLMAGAPALGLCLGEARIASAILLHQEVVSRSANAFFLITTAWLILPLGLGLMVIEADLLGRFVVPGKGQASDGSVRLKRRRGIGGYQHDVLTSTEKIIKRSLASR